MHLGHRRGFTAQGRHCVFAVLMLAHDRQRGLETLLKKTEVFFEHAIIVDQVVIDVSQDAVRVSERSRLERLRTVVAQ